MRDFYGKMFLSVRWLFRFFWKKQKIINEQNIIPGAIYVSHHQNQYGPYTILLFFPRPIHLWTFYPFCTQKDCFEQYMKYTMTERLGWNKIFATIIGYPLSFLVSNFCKSANCIPVYHDTRSIRTFRQTVKALQKDESVLIFADIDYTDEADEMGDMYKGFLSLDKHYYKATGKHIPFVPIYASKNRNDITVARAIYFDENSDFDSEIERVHEYIRNEINRMAKG